MHRWPLRSRLPRWGLSISLLGSSACVSNTIELEDETTHGDPTDAESTSTTTSGPDTVTNPVTTSTVTSGPGTMTTADSGSGSDTAGNVGYCQYSCEAPSDCDFGGDWACVDGFCEYQGRLFECDPAQCDDLGIGVCADVDGFSQCTFPCTPGGGECDTLMLECTGTDDAGGSICAPPPCNGFGEGELCEFEGFGSVGICIDGLCVCTSDAHCTGDGLACAPL